MRRSRPGSSPGQGQPSHPFLVGSATGFAGLLLGLTMLASGCAGSSPMPPPVPSVDWVQGTLFRIRVTMGDAPMQLLLPPPEAQPEALLDWIVERCAVLQP